MEEEKIVFTRMLAEGGYGRIYYAHEKTDYVYKIFYSKDYPISCIEMDCLTRLKHPNLMQANNFYTIAKLPSTMKKKNEEEVILTKDFKNPYVVIQMERADHDMTNWKYYEDPTFDEIVKVLWDVLKAVEFLHKCHLLHLDIKTENILIGDDGRGILTDFGLVIPLTNHTRARMYEREMITKLYRPPENLDKKDPNRKLYRQASDVWSLGVLFAEMFMPKDKGYFIEYNQVKKIKTLLAPKNIEGFLNTKIGRGLTIEQKSSLYPLLYKMFDFNPKRRPIVSEVMQHSFFSSLGFKYEEVEKGEILQPTFPPPASPLNTEDYALKLEYFLHNMFTLIDFDSKRYGVDFPIKIFFIGADVFLRNRHHFDNVSDLIGISIYCASQICCEYEISSNTIEKSLGIYNLDEKWRKLIFKQEIAGIFMTATPFDYATCACKLEKALHALFKEPLAYFDMMETFHISKNGCGKIPNTSFLHWKSKIKEYLPMYK